MRNFTPIGHGSRFRRPDFTSDEERGLIKQWLSSDCAWEDCRHSRFFDMPVCKAHAVIIYGRVKGALENRPPSPDFPAKFAPFVYYLMVGPGTVKIGTTSGLPARLSQLRTDAQYVVAIERGGRDLERTRHLEFASERLGRREDFRLSDRLKSHIEALQPDRDELVAYALSNPKVTA